MGMRERLSSLFTPTPVSKMFGGYPNWIYNKIKKNVFK